MQQTLSFDQIRYLRMMSQRLHPETIQTVSDPYDVVKSLVGIQAQELSSAALALRVRSADLTTESVKQARENERSIVMTWCMRGTLHLIAADDLGWMLSLFGPEYIQMSKRRFQQLSLDSGILIRARRIIRETLGIQGALHRAQLAQALAAKGIPVEGQAIYHLVRYAALNGDICFGPEVEGELTYVPLEKWLPAAVGETDKKNFSKLAGRYLEAFGPAAPEDLASWAGISIAEARSGFDEISRELIEFKCMGSPVWMLSEKASWSEEAFATPVVKLLPRYDSYLLGYQNRNWMVAQAYERQIHPGGGIIHQTMICNGAAIGVWRSENSRKKSKIVVTPFESVLAEALPGLDSEVQDIGRFLNRPTELQLDVPRS
jgi:hypothetical protein